MGEKDEEKQAKEGRKYYGTTVETTRVGGLAAGSADSENDRGVSRIKEARRGEWEKRRRRRRENKKFVERRGGGRRGTNDK